MNTSTFLPHLRNLPAYKDQIVHIEHIPPREATYGELEEPLHPALHASLESNRLLPLYSHQASAINAVRAGRNVMVVTPAASGKTLCYNIPVLDTILTHRGSRALYLFPTKALAQDQLRSLKELTAPQRIKLNYATFDGDTPQWERTEIKRSAEIVLSNPDMVHLVILPNHRSWSGLLSRLKYIVIDEAHIYRGVFGSHVANVLRRLKRLCTFYGVSPQLICCSATIANPKEHVERLTGLPFDVIAEDGSPHGGKDFVFWNPPLLDEARSARRSANSEATLILTELVQQGIRSLAFARSRRLTELIYLYVRDQLSQKEPELAKMVKPYRAGYLAEDRRQIERELFEGHLLAAVATTALELGVDIGGLDATVLTGYPGSIASTWQQAGRSGRSEESSLSFLIGLDNPLDQYLMRHPDFFFGKSHENALIDPDNLRILKPHLICAAWELPLSDGDERLFGDSCSQAEAELEGEGLLRRRGRRWYPSPRVVYPAQEINIRSTSSQNYQLVDVTSGRLLETVEEANAFFQIHPGAVYLHQGESYLVTELDLEMRTAYAVPTDAPYYTQTKDITDISILTASLEKAIGDITVHLGDVEVTTTVLGFKKKRIFTEEVIGEEPLDLPPHSFPTVALWFEIPPQVEEKLAAAGLDFAGGLHAAEHAAIALLPLFALCDRNDIGGVSTPLHPDTGKAQIFIYDAYPGGIGIAEKGFELITGLWQATLKAISGCPCQEGCPGCIQSPKCGNNNEPLDKKAAVVILEELVGGKKQRRG
ncbi:MAG: DEAD/DEAH box helicase [Dehalococcoidia bacterium]|nr:MAG: DEAD/DEAH box helicase [Dehalococcoidia bacterium]